jgi:CRP/FNR family transcriptional regulator
MTLSHPGRVFCDWSHSSDEFTVASPLTSSEGGVIMPDLTKAGLFFPFLSALPAQDLSQLANVAREVRSPKGTLLLKRGDEIGGAYLVLHGELQVFTLSAEGREAALHTVRGGESCIFALNAMFSRVVYPAWVRVTSPEVRILYLGGEVFRPLFDRSKVVRDWVLKVQSQRIFDLVSALEEVQLLSVEERLKSCLIRQMDGCQRVRQTHEELAGHIGTSREVVSRHLRKLAHAGWVTLRRREIRITTPESLVPEVS